MVHSLKAKLTVYFSALLIFSLGAMTLLFNLTLDNLPTTNASARYSRSLSRSRSSTCQKAKAITLTQ